jgi:hypothetical protein
MRFMIIVPAPAASRSGIAPAAGLMAAMAGYHQELARAGVLLAADGLQPSSRGWRIRYHGGQRSVIDGPFPETLIAGYTLIQVRSREEALEWTRRCPPPFGAREDTEIEVREVLELDDLGPQSGTGSANR